MKCYWENPAEYEHIALSVIRRLDMVWTEEEVEEFIQLQKKAISLGESMPDYVKAVLRKHLSKNDIS